MDTPIKVGGDSQDTYEIIDRKTTKKKYTTHTPTHAPYPPPPTLTKPHKQGYLRRVILLDLECYLPYSLHGQLSGFPQPPHHNLRVDIIFNETFAVPQNLTSQEHH